MKKRIVVLCDGTWNSRDQGNRNNITLLAQSILPTAPDGTAQLVYYNAGVGTEWGTIARITGGAFGRGLSKNLQDSYRFVVDNFEPGDDLYLFGFSRGAYTARSLGGLIRKCWVLRKASSHRFADAYGIYRITAGGADSAPAQAFRWEHSHHPVDADKKDWRQAIRFIGVFDTVGSLGVPGGAFSWIARNRFGFHDVKLSSSVQGAFHALAIDERRKPFEPTVWDTDPTADQEVAQVWFAGAHSDIGGGPKEGGLSDIAFRWMAGNAMRHELVLDSAIVDDFCRPDNVRQIHEVKEWYYRPLGRYVRPINGTKTSVDPSAIGFFRDGLSRTFPTYQPLNLKTFIDANPGR